MLEGILSDTPKPRELLNPFEKSVIKDFYRTFPFSQGNNVLHRIQFLHIASFYTKDEQISIINSPNLRIAAVSLNMPNPAHSIIREEPSKQFANRWEDFLSEIKIAVELSNSFSRDNSTYTFGSIFLEKDIYYVQTGRSALAHVGKYESFLRTYCLQERKTGSEGIDDLFRRLKRICLNLRGEQMDFDPELIQSWNTHPYRKQALGQDLETLVKIWETKHPGQKFFEPKSSLQS